MFFIAFVAANTEGDKKGDKAPAEDKVWHGDNYDDIIADGEAAFVSKFLRLCVCLWYQSKKLHPGKIGVFSQSHYYLALYRFKAIEKDDLDVQ